MNSLEWNKMKKEEIKYEDYLDKNVKVFKEGKQEPTTGKLIIIKKK